MVCNFNVAIVPMCSGRVQADNSTSCNSDVTVVLIRSMHVQIDNSMTGNFSITIDMIIRDLVRIDNIGVHVRINVPVIYNSNTAIAVMTGALSPINISMVCNSSITIAGALMPSAHDPANNSLNCIFNEGNVHAVRTAIGSARRNSTGGGLIRNPCMPPPLVGIPLAGPAQSRECFDGRLVCDNRHAGSPVFGNGNGDAGMALGLRGRIFDLGNPPLFRVVIVNYGDGMNTRVVSHRGINTPEINTASDASEGIGDCLRAFGLLVVNGRNFQNRACLSLHENHIRIMDDIIVNRCEHKQD